MFFALPNLSSQVIRPIEGPWAEPAAPKDLLNQSKVQFSEWCMQPSTKHCFFNMAEGMDPLRRISDSDNNRVVALHGFVADVDREIPDQHFTIEYITKKAKSEFLPNYASRTHSGNGRLVWMFPTPVFVPNQAAATAFYKQLAAEIKLKSIWGQPDDASYKPNQYYERGRDWIEVSQDKIPSNFLEMWLFESGRNIAYVNDERELQLDWEDVDARFHELYPEKWPGKIEEGVRGPAFWRETLSGNSAVVRKGGIQDFGGEFRTWSDLLGRDWVNQKYSDRLGAVLRCIWYDGKNWYFFDPDEPDQVLDYNQTNLERLLRVRYNISSKKIQGRDHSQLDEVLDKGASLAKRIAGIGSFMHFPPGLISAGPDVFLNNSMTKALEPAPDPGEAIGELNKPIPFGHEFPYIASYLKHVYPKDSNLVSPLEYLLSWLKYGYAHALKQEPKRGQAVILVGPHDSGKSFFIELIVAQLMGGFGCHVARPFAFAKGDSKYNDQAYRYPVWSLDDEDVKTERENASYTNFLKQTVALGSHRVSGKWLKDATVLWYGRIMVAFNEDGHSARQMPNVDASILDKIMMFRARGGFKFLPPAELKATIQKELPHFARWLLNWRIPPHCVGSSRYGIKPYHDPLLLRTAYENGANYEFSEMLKLFLRNFRFQQEAGGKEVSEWVGTSSQLILDLNAWNSSAARSYNSRAVGMALTDLMRKGLNIRMVRSRSDRTWYIPISLELSVDGNADGGDYEVVPLTDEDINRMNKEAIESEL